MRTVRHLKHTVNVNGQPRLFNVGEWAAETLSPDKYLEYLADQEIIDDKLAPYYANKDLFDVPVLEEINTERGVIKQIVGMDYVQNIDIDPPPEFQKWYIEMQKDPNVITFRPYYILP